MANNIPTFTPPAPTFTPPSNAHAGVATCHFHQNERAVAKCVKCGKQICQDCVDTYQVNDEEYDGKPLCYDCWKEMVSKNVKRLRWQKTKIIFMYIFSILGMIFGGIVGNGFVSLEPNSDELFWIPILTALVGGCLWTFIVKILKAFWHAIKNFFDGDWLFGIIEFVIEILLAVVTSIWGTIKKLFNYTKHLIKTSGFIKADANALRQMAEYMEYTRVRSQNVGVDLATLASESGELYNNTFAQTVLQNGDASAETMIRDCAMTINSHGEIVRNFDESEAVINENGEILRRFRSNRRS